MPKPAQKLYQFADFQLDTAAQVLRREGEVIALRPKLYELLLYLIEHRGTVLSKEEIQRAVWNGQSQGSPYQPSANLNVNISNLRQALGDNPIEPRFISTVSRRGYEFVAEVQEALPPVVEAHSDGNWINQNQTKENQTRESQLNENQNGYAGHQGNEEGLAEAEVATFVEQAELAAISQVEDGAEDNAAVTDEGRTANSESAAVHRRPAQRRWLLLGSAALVVALLGGLLWPLLRAKFSPPPKHSTPQGQQAPSPWLNGGLPPAGNTPASADEPSNPPRAQAALRVDGLDPAMPLAWVGDKPITVRGAGFQPGLSVTIFFPGGGDATLSGEGQVQRVTTSSFTLLVAFNNNAGEYRLRVNLPDNTQSNLFHFRVAPINLWPQIAAIAQIDSVDGLQRITVTGYNFQQGMSVRLTHPSGRVELVPPTLVRRASDTSFDLLVDGRGQTGSFRLQALNPNGRASSIASFELAVR